MIVFSGPRRSPNLFVRSRGALLMAMVLLGTSACEHPIRIVTPHIEAADLVVSDHGGRVLAKTEFNRTWSVDFLTLEDGVPLRVVLTPIDFRGEPIEVAGRGDISFRMEAENGALLQWEPQRDFGWIRPFAHGETRVRFLIWHQTHADFVTPWLRVVVSPPALPR
jgi:hypothetical protein